MVGGLVALALPPDRPDLVADLLAPWWLGPAVAARSGEEPGGDHVTRPACRRGSRGPRTDIARCPRWGGDVCARRDNLAGRCPSACPACRCRAATLSWSTTSATHRYRSGSTRSAGERWRSRQRCARAGRLPPSESASGTLQGEVRVPESITETSAGDVSRRSGLTGPDPSEDRAPGRHHGNNGAQQDQGCGRRFCVGLVPDQVRAADQGLIPLVNARKRAH